MKKGRSISKNREAGFRRLNIDLSAKTKPTSKLIPNMKKRLLLTDEEEEIGGTGRKKSKEIRVAGSGN